MGSLFLRIRTWWETADRTQKVVTVVGGGLLAFLVGITTYIASKPKMDLLYGGLDATDQGTVAQELQKLGIPVEVDERGNVRVPSNLVAEARGKLAVAGKQPKSGHAGFADLPGLGPMSTPRIEQENIRRAIEGELATTIESLEGIRSARVHITTGSDSPFLTEERAPSASVAITEEPGAILSDQRAQAIAQIVARSVSGMKPSQVTVIDSMGTIRWDGASSEGANGMGDRKISAQIAEGQRIERDLQRKLDAAFGPGNTLVSAQVEMDFDKRRIETVERMPSDTPVSTEQNTETMGGAAGGIGGVGGIAGSLANTPGAPAAQPGAGSSPSYTGQQKSTTYQPDAKVNSTYTEKATGEVVRMSISVLADSKKIKNVQAVQAFLDAYLGPRAAQPDKFTAAVTSVEFDRAAAEAEVKANAEAGSRARMQQIISLLPIAALLVVGFLVVKAIGKVAKEQSILVHALPDGRLVSSGASGGSYAMPELGARTGSHAHSPHGESRSDGHTETPGLRIRDVEPEIEEVDAIRQKLNVPLEQIKRMASDRPDTVAMLLKTWLLEERR
jgi:flagellar M-ring protein FliF